jgi:hypothetical protein
LVIEQLHEPNGFVSSPLIKKWILVEGWPIIQKNYESNEILRMADNSSISGYVAHEKYATHFEQLNIKHLHAHADEVREEQINEQK